MVRIWMSLHKCTCAVSSKKHSWTLPEQEKAPEEGRAWKYITAGSVEAMNTIILKNKNDEKSDNNDIA